MITEEKLAELRKWNQGHRENDTWMSHSPDKMDEMLDTLSALWRVAREASNIEDMVEVPDNLGASATVTCEVAIRKFRESLAALHEEEK